MLGLRALVAVFTTVQPREKDHRPTSDTRLLLNWITFLWLKDTGLGHDCNSLTDPGTAAQNI